LIAPVQNNHGSLLWSTADDVIYGMPRSLDQSTYKKNETGEAAWHYGQSQDAHNHLFQGVDQTASSRGNPTLCTKISK